VDQFQGKSANIASSSSMARMGIDSFDVNQSNNYHLQVKASTQK
jgi:hypothetical protein